MDNAKQLHKIGFYADHMYQCIKMISYDAENLELNKEQISMILTEDPVIPFQ
jgi:magnesium transporter